MICLSRECSKLCKLGLTVEVGSEQAPFVVRLATVESKMLAIPMDGACSHFHGHHIGRLLMPIRTNASCNIVLQPI